MVELEGSAEFPYRATFVEPSEPKHVVLKAEAIPGWLELMGQPRGDPGEQVGSPDGPETRSSSHPSL